MENTGVISVASLIEANGKTWRENNLAKEHTIEVGTLVEVISSGLRLYVYGHSRDCDGTPLYHLTMNKELIGQKVWHAAGYPADFHDQAIDLAYGVFSGHGSRVECLTAAKCFLALQLGIKQGAICWNATSEDDLRVVNTDTVEEAK